MANFAGWPLRLAHSVVELARLDCANEAQSAIADPLLDALIGVAREIVQRENATPAAGAALN